MVTNALGKNVNPLVKFNYVETKVIQFKFATGSLPVQYLGLPLRTKNMTITDYLPLIEKIRKRISSWTERFLSCARRLQLINLVIMSLTNFWMAAFRLPSSCVKKIERLCSTFFWCGPDLNEKKNKIAWKEICKTKQEGGSWSEIIKRGELG